MRRGFAVIAIIGGLVVAAIVLYFPAYFWFFPYLHDQTLSRFSQDLTDVRLPPNTQEIERLHRVGQQSGNSDHCDYFAGEMFRTDLSKEQFEEYYRNHYNGESSVRFFWINQDNVEDIGIFTLKDWIIQKENNLGQQTVVVYIFEGAMTSAVDYRCS